MKPEGLSQLARSGCLVRELVGFGRLLDYLGCLDPDLPHLIHERGALAPWREMIMINARGGLLHDLSRL